MTESNFSFTTKVNGDLFTVRGNTPEEFDANLTAAIISGLHDKAAALQEAVIADVHIESSATPTIQQEQPAAPITAAPAAPAGLEILQDRWGNKYTYGHPDAPDLGDGRGKYIQKSGVSKAGNPYVAWVDPVKGPKPARPGASEAPPIYLNSR